MNKFALKNMTVRRYVMIEMRLAKMNEAKMCFTLLMMLENIRINKVLYNGLKIIQI